MTNKDASFILGACRPNGLDSADPEFEDALAQAATDPVLKGWYDDQRRFDSGIASALQSVPVPGDLRARILAGGRVSQHEAWFSARRLWAIAAMLIVFAGLGAWYSLERHGEGWDDEAIATLSQLVSGESKFDLQSRNVTDLQQWLRSNGSPSTAAIPGGLKGLASLGCKTISWHGHPISLICFHGENGELVHLAMVDKASLSNPPPEGEPVYRDKDGWRMASWSQGDMAMMLLTRGSESQLRSILAMMLLF